MLGVSKFYIYDDSSSKNVKKILEYYEEQGIVEVFAWHMEQGYSISTFIVQKSSLNFKFFVSEYKHDKDLRLTGLLNAFTDCLYRARVVDNFKYLLNLDYDEIFMAFDGTETLQEFVQKYDTGSFHSLKFQTALFLPKFKHDYSSVPNNTGNLNILEML